MFETEIKMMCDTLEKMNDLLGPENRLNGQYLHVQFGSPSFLVIEDLAPLGFCMTTLKLGLDLDHSLLAVRSLARFHASSVAVCEKVCIRRIFKKTLNIYSMENGFLGTLPERIVPKRQLFSISATRTSCFFQSFNTTNSK